MTEPELLNRLEEVRRQMRELESQRTYTAADEAYINPTLTALSNEIDNIQAALIR
jgi:hypothetical protein